MALLFAGISSLMGSINYITTIIMLRAPGMKMFRMPMTVWALFITALLQAFALPVLTSALVMQLLDRDGGDELLPAGRLDGGQRAARASAAARRCCGSTCSGSTRTRPSTS